MSNSRPIKIAAQTAEELCRRFTPSPEARALPPAAMTPRQYADALAAKALFLDALKLLAFALPKREAVWWACVCLRAALKASPKRTQSLVAAEAWVADPSDRNRRIAGTTAEQTGYDDPAAMAAMAAFWSGGSLAPEKFEPVPPPEHLTATAVVNAIQITAVLEEAEKAPEKFGRFLELGWEVADGRNVWKQPPPAA